MAPIEGTGGRRRGIVAAEKTPDGPGLLTVLNGMSRYHLAAEAIRRSAEYPNSRPQTSAPTLISRCEALISKANAYAREHLEDPPEIREWRWSP